MSYWLYYLQRLFLTCFITVLIFLSWKANGQQKLQVVEKTIEKEIPYNPKETISIIAEKAEIKIKGWEKDYIKFSLKLIARHENKDVATKELQYMKYAITKEENIIEFGNRFDFPPELKSVKSSLKIVYEIQMPYKAVLSIDGKYSDTELINLSNKIDGTFQFGSITLSNIKGRVNLNSSFADITGHGIDAIFYCRSNKADIILENLKGSYHFNCAFGNMDISPENIVKDLTINASRSDINLIIPDFDSYAYTLSTVSAPIEIDSENYTKQIQSNDGNQSFKSKRKPNNPLIKIITTYSSIHLNK